MNESINIPGFRRVPRTGVIYVMHRAEQAGYGLDYAEQNRTLPYIGNVTPTD